MRVVIATLFVFLGCCTNVIFLELLVKEQPGCSNLITFAQFLFISVEGFIFATHFGKRRPVVPLKHYVMLVVMFFLVNVANNNALSYDISMPLHMIFKSARLIQTRFHHRQLQDKPGVPAEMGSFYNKCKGIALLTFSLLLSARMGIYQESLASRYGKHPRESLFYAHALPLPGFLLLVPNIYSHAVSFAQTEPLPYPLLALIPKAWVYLLCNVVTQYVCIRSVYVLTTECSSLTVTLVITLRKFVSLLLSIHYFQNPFTAVHWFGTALVFAGTLVFTEVFPRLRSAARPPLKAE
ncbi:unnamed protein product [Ixodes hexagonus]